MIKERWEKYIGTDNQITVVKEKLKKLKCDFNKLNI